MKVHRRVTRLIIVVAPTVKDVFAVAVHIDEVVNAGILIEHPDRVFRLRLRHRAGTDVNLVVARICRVLDGRRRIIIRRIVPKEIVVPINVNADTTWLVMSCGRRTPILAPHRVGGHAVVPSIGIALRKNIGVFCFDDLFDFDRVLYGSV